MAAPSLPLHRSSTADDDNDAAARLYEEMHPIEAADSWAAHIKSSHLNNPNSVAVDDAPSDATAATRRQLRHSHHHRHHNDDDFDATSYEEVKYQQDIQTKAQQQHIADKKLLKAAKKRQRRYQELYTNSGIGSQSVHGLMIDAGSTGSRMHVYEFEPRVLMNKHEVAQAVSGKKLSFPGTNSRWTERLRPGISEFANIDNDEEMERAIAEYLEPLLSFARTVLHRKEEEFGNFPIFLKATAGLRIVPSKQRQRVISTVRKLFANETFCPFWDETERVRVISGEEEAVYDWAGVNFLLGNLMSNSEGVGEAYGGAIQTYGALDMGGASSQISYYQPEGDVMSGLFKLQIGQGKHWNVYAHSHLMYGMNEAENRRKAHLVADTTAKARLQDGVYDPCLPGGGKKTIEFKSIVHIGDNGLETWNATVDDFASVSSNPGLYHAVLVNNEKKGDWDQCKELARKLFNKESNAWCNYSHRGSCSFAGVYQPERPSPELEFYAFSNYFHVWQFLQLESRSSIAQLDAKGQEVCSQSWDDLVQYNEGNQQNIFTEEELKTYCFRAAYVHEILHSGYGFKPDEYVIATDVVNAQKVTWALGSILYEINTLPWEYIEIHGKSHVDKRVQNDFLAEWGHQFSMFLTGVVIASILGVLLVFRRHSKRSGHKDGYEYLREAANTVEIEKLPRRSLP
eukprot:scaffold387_cov136-Skeletonema_menzelii.AAC.7